MAGFGVFVCFRNGLCTRDPAHGRKGETHLMERVEEAWIAGIETVIYGN